MRSMEFLPISYFELFKKKSWKLLEIAKSDEYKWTE